MNDSDSSLELHDIEPDEEVIAFGYHDPLTLSPQLQAVVEDNVERLHDLLQRGKSVNINDNQGNTPLHVAVMKEKRIVFDYLLTVDDIRLDAENFEGLTPLMYAVKLQDDYYTLKLLENKVEINVICNLGKTPLHLAVEANNEAIAEALIKRGAYVNCQDADGVTPLHIACRDNNSSIHLLLYYRADAKIENLEHETAFGLGLCHCPLEIHEILYNYTYDDLKAEMIDVKTLTTTMMHNGPFFHRLIQRNLVVYDSEKFSFLNASIRHIRSETFKAFMDRYDSVAEDFFRDYNPLNSFRFSYNFPHRPVKPFVDFFYMVCESRFIHELVMTSRSNNFTIRLFARESEENAIRFVCCLFSYGFRTSVWTLCHIFWMYGYGELFSILLHMDLRPVISYTRMFRERPQFIVPALIRDINLSIDFLYAIEGRESWYFDTLRKLFKHPVIVEYEKGLQGGRDVHISPVPSLLQLSRDSGRQFLIQRFQIETDVQFFTMLKALPIAQVYKDILSYKRPIYRY